MSFWPAVSPWGPLHDCGSRFTPSTRVLIRDGTAIPIAGLKPGDKVPAASTSTSKTQFAAVAGVEVNHDHDLYDLCVKTGGRDTVIHTTASHLLKVSPYLDKFIPAKHLKTGEHLKTPDGTIATAEGGSTPKVRDRWMWDSTVPGNNDHDFYVLLATGSSRQNYHAVTGNTPVLVHNSGCFDPAEVGARLPSYTGGETSGIGVAAGGRVYDVVSGSKNADADLLETVNNRLRSAGRLPGTARSARASDAEQKFAAIMIRDGIENANLVINNPVGPCTVILGCDDVPDTILGNKTLTVHWPDGDGGWMSHTYGRVG